MLSQNASECAYPRRLEAAPVAPHGNLYRKQCYTVRIVWGVCIASCDRFLPKCLLLPFSACGTVCTDLDFVSALLHPFVFFPLLFLPSLLCMLNCLQRCRICLCPPSSSRFLSFTLPSLLFYLCLL
jgi:hypothetical protein